MHSVHFWYGASVAGAIVFGILTVVMAVLAVSCIIDGDGDRRAATIAAVVVLLCGLGFVGCVGSANGLSTGHDCPVWTAEGCS